MKDLDEHSLPIGILILPPFVPITHSFQIESSLKSSEHHGKERALRRSKYW